MVEKVKPTGHVVLVKPDSIDEKTSGGIIRPEHTRQRLELATVYGTILAIGSQSWKDFGDGQPWAKVGDRVVFAKYGGLELTDEETNKIYRLLNDEDILGVIEEDNEEK